MQQQAKNIRLGIYPNAPFTSRITEISGKKYKVISHYVGNKDINKVIHDLAIKEAYADMEITA